MHNCLGCFFFQLISIIEFSSIVQLMIEKNAWKYKNTTSFFKESQIVQFFYIIMPYIVRQSVKSKKKFSETVLFPLTNWDSKIVILHTGYKKSI